MAMMKLRLVYARILQMSGSSRGSLHTSRHVGRRRVELISLSPIQILIAAHCKHLLRTGELKQDERATLRDGVDHMKVPRTL